MRLDKWQRNAIFEAVEAGGLDARECALEYDDAEARITHAPSESYITLVQEGLRYSGNYVVGQSAVAWPYEAFIWGRVKDEVQRWAEKVKRDVDTPDLWAELQREREIFTGARDDVVANTPFTSDEQAEIAEQLRQIKEVVTKTYSLSEAQTRSLEAKLDDIVAAAGRIGRKDWRLLFYGVMFEVIVTELLPPYAVRGIIVMVLRGLAHLFDVVVGPPQLPPLA